MSDFEQRNICFTKGITCSHATNHGGCESSACIAQGLLKDDIVPMEETNMTNGEALEEIKRNVWYNEDSLKKHKELRDNRDAINLAMRALEKQIPKPVVQSTEDCRCPVCGSYVGIDMDELFCSVCGQALDWEAEEDV